MRENKRLVCTVSQAAVAGLLIAQFAGLAVAGTITTATTYEYDATKGFLTAKVENPDEPNLNRRTQYTYDAYGNRLTTVVSSTATGTYAVPTRTVERVNYDTLNISPTTYVNALLQWANVQYDPANLPLYIDSLNGLRTNWTYDTFGRPINATHPDGSYSGWYYALCSSSNPCSIANAISVTSSTLNSADTQIHGPATKKYFDVLNRVIRTETTGFDGTSKIVVDTEYDKFGRISRTSRPYYPGQTIRWTLYNYDALGRAIDVTEADGGVTHTEYNGFTTTVTNALNQKRSTTVDSRGLVVQVVDDASNALKYQYDPAGRLTQTTDPKGNTVKIAYDLIGNKVSMTDPDLGTINYVYDTLGQLRQQTDAKGQVVTYQYDLLGRVTNRVEPDLVSTWTYDACYMGKGKLCSTSADNGFNLTKTYDNYGRLSKSTSTIGSDYTSAYTYDAIGRLLTLQYPSGLIVQYNYTTSGYLNSITKYPYTTWYWKANRMDAEGHYLEQAYGNSVVTQQDFDPATGHITAIRAGTNNAVQNLAYTYDKHGNMLTRSDSNQSLWEGFLYDNINRLTSNSINSTGAGVITQTYAYDSLGNITSRSDAGNYTYGAVNAQPHAVAQITRADGSIRQFAYDASGNLVQEVERDALNNVITAKGRTESWTSFNMPLKLANTSTSIQYVYDTNHQRIKEINPAYTTYFVHPDNSGGLLYEKDVKTSTSVEHRNFITAGSGGVVAIVKRDYVGTETVVYLHHDNLGSVTTVTDNSGNVIERMAYEPFGRRRIPVGSFDSNGTLTGMSTNRGFTNHEELDSLGLAHMNGRIYDPTIGRFIAADPTKPNPKDLQSFNRYSYVNNNPLVNFDPSGFYCYQATGGLGVIRQCGNDNGEFTIPMYAAMNDALYGPGPWDPVNAAKMEGGTFEWKDSDIISVSVEVFGERCSQAGTCIDGISDAPIQTICPECYLIGSGSILRSGVDVVRGIGDIAWGGASILKSGVSVWSLNPFARGWAIDKALGSNLPSNFPVIDKFVNGVATSIKSLDLNAKSYQDANTLAIAIKDYIDPLASFTSRTWAGVTVDGVNSRVLQLALPGIGTEAQQSVIVQAVNYATSVGVKLEPIVVH